MVDKVKESSRALSLYYVGLEVNVGLLMFSTEKRGMCGGQNAPSLREYGVSPKRQDDYKE